MIGRHHQPRNVVEAMYHCNKCAKATMHRVDNGHKGPCLECMKRHDAASDERKQQAPLAVQGGLFL